VASFPEGGSVDQLRAGSGQEIDSQEIDKMGGIRVPSPCVVFCLFLASVDLISAANDTEISPPPAQHQQNTSLPEDATEDATAMVTRHSGLRFFDLVAGQGESPVPGETVTVHYVAGYASQGQVITKEHHGMQANSKYSDTKYRMPVAMGARADNTKSGK
jgi:hypothetical protein